MGVLNKGLQVDAVAALQQRFVQRLDADLDAALGERSVAAGTREALRRLVVQGLRFGVQYRPAQLAKLADGPVAEIETRRTALEPLFPPTEVARIEKAAAERGDADRYDAVFGDRERLYLPLSRGGDTATERAVAEALEGAGYRVTDYAEGKATDRQGKQSFRIGKLLERVAPQLSADFQHDAARSGSNLLLCLSRAPMDLARMSTGREWTSCVAYGDKNWSYVADDVKGGTLVAYLIRDTDTELTNPLARVLLKPYLSADGSARMLRSSKTYGLANADFDLTAQEIAAALSADVPEGKYTLRRGLYQDGLPGAMLKLPETCSAARFFDIAGVDYRVEPDGSLVAPRVALMDLDLQRLPDLSMVTVEGDFRCSFNKLTSLDGLPQRIDGSIDLFSNRLESLRGLPAEVHGDFNCGGNALTSLEHAPQSVAGSFSCGANKLTSLAHAPAQVGRDYSCGGNPLADLQGVPAHIRGKFTCSFAPELQSLAGGPQQVDGDVDIRSTGLRSLQGAPQRVGGQLSLNNNRLSDMQGGPMEVTGSIDLGGNPLKSLAGAPHSFARLTCSLGRFAGPEDIPPALRVPVAPAPAPAAAVSVAAPALRRAP